jgi:LacI family transcriptional regulator
MSLFTSSNNTNSKHKRVALLIETSNEYARRLLSGINSYIREHHPWSIYLSEYSRNNIDFTWLNEWQGDGIIARIENEQITRYILEANVPTVDLSASRMIPTLPYLETDDKAIARMAADHLIERGFTNFGFCGDSQFRWSKLRHTYFTEYLTHLGYPCYSYTSSEDSIGGMVQWLHKLPKPIGIMACYDIRGRQLLEACRHAELAVPDEVGVLGVDNDELLCELSNPPLSSVKSNPFRTGYLAADLLDRMMTGEKVGALAQLIEPIDIHVRLSTDVLVVDDKLVSDAVRFIRDHAYDDIQVQDIVEHLSASRRSLESRFYKALGHTPHDEIVKVKIKFVKRLLLETELPLAIIAERAGFKHTEYMSVVFKRVTGIRPGQFREKHK